MTHNTQMTDRTAIQSTPLYIDDTTHTQPFLPIDELDSVTKDITFNCQSGRVITGTWTGIPIDSFLDHAVTPANTTHLMVISRTDYRACIPVTQALDALLAFDKRGEQLSTHAPSLPRIIGPNIDGPRTVKAVHQINAISLPSSVDPTALEYLPD